MGPIVGHLIFRNADGSLTWAGYWLIVIGGVMIAGGAVHVANRYPRRWLPGFFPRPLQIAFGIVSAAVGAGFILWAVTSRPGILY